MNGKNTDTISRRDFIRNGSLAAAGTVAAGLASGGCGGVSAKKKLKPSKILNQNPQMHYRRLGKTNLWLSEVSLGGHWKNRNAGRYWGKFADDQVPDDAMKNRTDVINACIDAGINYLDITTPAECLVYGAALKGRRDRMYVGADDYTLCIRSERYRNVKDQLFNIDECLRRLQTDHLDIWRPQARMDGSNTDAEVEVAIEAFGKAHKAGKVRHMGMSTHNRPWVQHVIEKYPQIEMFIFPCTAKTREKGLAATKENVVEADPGHGADQSRSVFATLRQRDVGLVTIKPFMGGNLFASHGQDKFPVMGVGTKEENDLARLTLQCILSNDAITATVPGCSTVYEVENAARASYTRQAGTSEADRLWLDGRTERQWANLPRNYAWLRDWKVV
jgi:predicted aldo/keto reductase-like oxidoreductase